MYFVVMNLCCPSVQRHCMLRNWTCVLYAMIIIQSHSKHIPVLARICGCDTSFCKVGNIALAGDTKHLMNGMSESMLYLPHKNRRNVECSV